MKIKSLHDTSFGILFKAFSQAFTDYETQVNELQLQVINTDTTYISITDFLKAINIDLKRKQFDMIKTL